MTKLSDLSKEELQEKLKIEIKKIIDTHWNWIYEDWKTIEKKFDHRTKMKTIENIDVVKQKLSEKLGYIPVFYFLNIWKEPKDQPGPYNNLESLLLLLYQMVEGIVNRKAEIPQSSFQHLFKAFWSEPKETSKKNNQILGTMFSTTRSRVLFSRINNPNGFESTTIHIDGFDDRINYNDKKEIETYHSGAFYGYKFKKNGVRTNCADSSEGYCLQVSDSLPCSEIVDGSQIHPRRFKLYQYLNPKLDQIFTDGGYVLFF